MSDIHIDDFYRDAAKTLSQLYAFFPRPSAVYVEDIAGPDSPDEFGLHSTRHMAAFSTLLWLAKAGYLNYADTIRQEAIDQACLSHKGFTLLCAPCNCVESIAWLNAQQAGEKLPDSVQQERLSNIYIMRQLIAKGHSGEIRQFMLQLLNDGRQH